MNGLQEIRYKPAPTIGRFFYDRSHFVQGIKGPFGSGKSSGTAIKLMSMAQSQPPDIEGWRRSRYVVVRNCYSADTEIFTRRGWVAFPDLLPMDEVAALHGDSVQWEIPTYHYRAPYQGEMVTIRQQNADLCVTPEHHLWVSPRRTRQRLWGEFEHRRADEIEGIGELYRLRSRAVFPETGAQGDPTFFEFLGFWFAEGYAGAYPRKESAGTHYRLVVTHKPDEYVEQLLHAAGFNFTAQPKESSGNNYVISTKSPSVKRLIRELASYGKAKDKRIPRYVMTASRECRQAFLDGFHYGDGSGGDKARKERQAKCYHSRSEGLIDDLHELIVLNGGSANKWYDKAAEMWGLTELGHVRSSPIILKQHWGREQYNGMVYCVEVSSHVVLVRRNGKAVWCGQTYRELLDTTMQDVFQPTGWFPKDEPDLGTYWHASDLIWEVYDEAGRFHTEWLFRALDRPDHVRKLLSLSLTGGWINEAREVGKPIVDGVFGRCGRYPRMQDYGWETSVEETAELIRKMQEEGYVPIVGKDIPYWYGLMMDTNPPDTDHWWYRVFEEERPSGYKLYSQPGAREKDAENLNNLHPLYYYNLAQGKSDDWINVYIDGQYGFVQDGKPVYPEFVDSRHTLSEAIEPLRGHEVVIGADTSGLTPAAVFLQKIMDTWVALAEVVATRLGPRNFAQEVARCANSTFQGCPIRQGWGDPAGNMGKGEIDSYFEALNDAKLPFDPVQTNDPVRRREAVASCLTTLSPQGYPRLKISPRCRYLRKGLMGAFKYKRMAIANEERYHDKRDKNPYSHPCEALEYALLGEGEGDYLIGAAPSDPNQMADDIYRNTMWSPRRLNLDEVA